MAKSRSRNTKKRTSYVARGGLMALGIAVLGVAGYLYFINTNKSTAPSKDATVQFRAPTPEQLEQLKKASNSF